jgi:hypothetical protein
VIFLLIVESGVFALDRLVKRFRERITIPRSGYLVQKRAHGLKLAIQWVVLVVVCGLLAAALAFFFAKGAGGMDWMPGVSGLLFAFALAFVGLRVSLARFYLLAGLTLLSGTALSLLGIGNLPGLALFWTVTGVILLASGGLTLRSFLRQTPLPAEAPDEQ